MSSKLEPSYVPHDVFAQNHLQILRQNKWCTCIRNHQSLRQSKPIVIRLATNVLSKSKGLEQEQDSWPCAFLLTALTQATFFGTLYRLYANVLRSSIVQEWCNQHNKIPDFQFGFSLGRSTLQPLFILRHHLKDCSPKTTSMHITTVCCFHRLQAGLQLYTQRHTVGALTPLSHVSPSTLHAPRLVLHRYAHTAGWGQASKCAARVWCEARLVRTVPSPLCFFPSTSMMLVSQTKVWGDVLQLQVRQPLASSLLCVMCMCVSIVCYVLCVMCHVCLYYVLQLQVRQSLASSLLWRHATILHRHIQIPGQGNAAKPTARTKHVQVLNCSLQFRALTLTLNLP
jgi:hypothetical protein